MGSSRVSRTAVLESGSSSSVGQSLAILLRMITSSSKIVGRFSGTCANKYHAISRRSRRSRALECSQGDRFQASGVPTLLTHALSNSNSQVNVLILIGIFQQCSAISPCIEHCTIWSGKLNIRTWRWFDGVDSSYYLPHDLQKPTSLVSTRRDNLGFSIDDIQVKSGRYSPPFEISFYGLSGRRITKILPVVGMLFLSQIR